MTTDLVDDVEAAVEFCNRHLDFAVRGNLRLLLSGPAGCPMPDGTTPAPGGWHRIHPVELFQSAAR
ncbi:hypothetical protein [Amycolatopsis sp. cmx-11-12]|uniref:hypothetical protein n=1 Tax=Amycolatopsis sp. cmx-11-12 TaxID=2785795 RepID=UPI0039181DFC